MGSNFTFTLKYCLWCIVSFLLAMGVFQSSSQLHSEKPALDTFLIQYYHDELLYLEFKQDKGYEIINQSSSVSIVLLQETVYKLITHPLADITEVICVSYHYKYFWNIQKAKHIILLFTGGTFTVGFLKRSNIVKLVIHFWNSHNNLMSW